MLIMRKIEIDMGHRVPQHKSKCRNLHGHRYVIELGVDDKIITTSGSSDEGMVIDFGDLKTILMEEIDAKFDHGFCMYKKDILSEIFTGFMNGLYINEIQTDTNEETGRVLVDGVENKMEKQKIILVDFIPTAENLAKYWFELMKPRLEERKIKIKFVKVWETLNTYAVYEE